MSKLLRDFLEIILCAYAVVKSFTKNRIPYYDEENVNIVDLITDLLHVIIVLVLYAIAALFLLPFIIFKKIIEVYLKNKYGSRYYGVLNGMDALWAAETKEAKHIINCAAFVHLNVPPKEFATTIKRKIKATNSKIFNSSIHSFLGYWYRLRSDEMVDNVVKLITLTSTETGMKSAFEKKMSKLANQALPPSSPYEVLFCVEPVKFHQNEDPKVETHVIILRLHHSMGDGVHFLSFLLKLADQADSYEINANAALLEKINNMKLGNKPPIYSKSKWLNSIHDAVNLIRDKPLYYFPLSNAEDSNTLHGPPLSGEKVLVFHTERRSEYLLKIKSIKRCFDHCRFTDVVYTALSASLFEYFSTHGKNIPENIHLYFVSSLPRVQTNENQEIQYDFVATTLVIPIRLADSTSASENLVLRLKTITTRQDILQKSIDYLLFYWLSRHIALLPTIISRKLCKLYMRSTITFSNLPRLKPLNVAGQDLQDIIFWTPNVSNMGAGVTFLTYDDRFGIGLLVDKILLPNPEEASGILENIYKYIDLLLEEVKCRK